MLSGKTLTVCNDHLKTLYTALKAGDVGTIRNLEDVLTVDEECVACAYALRITGPAREELYAFLRKQGFEVRVNETSASEALRFWSIRAILFFILFSVMWFVGSLVKLMLIQGQNTLSLGGFGLVTVLFFTVATFVLTEYWFLAD